MSQIPDLMSDPVKERLKREHLEQGTVRFGDLLVVFVSNADKTVPFWLQTASKRPDGCVVWDYHVVLVQPSASLAWDLDASLPCPSDLHRYIRQALHPEIKLQPSFRRCCLACFGCPCVLCRMYRLITAADYLKDFASDRRHMLKENGGWVAPPPRYSCIKNQKNEVHTLEKYWTMQKEEAEEADNDSYGYVLDERSFLLQMGLDPSGEDRNQNMKK